MAGPIGATAYGLAGGLPDMEHDVALAALFDAAPVSCMGLVGSPWGFIRPDALLVGFRTAFACAALLSLVSLLVWLGGLRDTRHLAHQP